MSKEIKISLRPDEEKVLKLINKNPRGICIKEIALKLDINEITASKRVEILARANLVDERKIGNLKLYYPRW